MPSVPIKITDKIWADKLQDGSFFMRSLYDYGMWGHIERVKNNDKKMKDQIQDDIGEGIVRTVDPRIGDVFFNNLPSAFSGHIMNCSYIAESYQYLKVFCMYGLTYLLDKKEYQRPDPRLKEFGDTAVILYQPNAFLARVLNGLKYKYGEYFNFKLDQIYYYPSNYYGELNEFCKHEMYAWQNEWRIRVALLNPKTSMIDETGRTMIQLIKSVDSVNLDIGDIRDISIQIPIDDLINLKLPEIIQNLCLEMSEEVPHA